MSTNACQSTKKKNVCVRARIEMRGSTSRMSEHLKKKLMHVRALEKKNGILSLTDYCEAWQTRYVC